MSSDRSWMYHRFNSNGHMTEDFVNGVESFLNFAFSQTQIVSQNKIRCPCSKCKNKKFLNRDEVKFHVYSKGFDKQYTWWYAHGEPYRNDVEVNVGGSSSNINDDINPYRRMVIDAAGLNFDCLDVEIEDGTPNPKAMEFFAMLEDADEPLWDGCKKQTKLSAISQLLNLKSECGMSEASFDRLISIIKTMLPDDDKLVDNYYNCKKLVTKLGLGYEKIDSCINMCILFYKEHESKLACPICGHPRFKPKRLVEGKQKNIPYKVLRYLPLAPRLQRLYMSGKTAEFMTWHANNHTLEGVVSHPNDSEAWKHFDQVYPSFAVEPRNVRIGLCTDGFNPFSQSATPYSCWPIIITVYNLPPWLCMKQSYMFLAMVIPGPKSPGKNIDVFLRPLIDELKLLWTDGVTTYDAHRKQNFQMRVALLWTISDFPAYAMLSGWSTHGKLACPYCMERTKAFTLKHGGKTSFFDCHRQFLPLSHSYRKQKDKFLNGRIEKDLPPPRLSGEEMLRQVCVLPNITFGIHHNKYKIVGFGDKHNWVKKSIFWELPYWHTNLIRHNLDVMHIERNVFENLFNTVMDIKGKTKDNVKARMDLKLYCRRPELELVEENGKVLKPKASYALTKDQKEEVCHWVKQLRFPDGYSSNIGHRVNLEECKFYGLKSHDCHVFMQRLIPIAFRELLPQAVWEAITELSIFFREICSSTLKVEHMVTIERNIVETLCKLEKIFPPGFFDSMEHLPVHLAYEARVGGPVQYRWMYPFERFLHHLKKKVRNRASVEGSICEAYIIEEISTFCSLYFEPNVQTRLNQTPRNDDGGDIEIEGSLSIFRHRGRAYGSSGIYKLMDLNEYKAAMFYILMNCDELVPLIEKFDDTLRLERPDISDEEIEKLREQNLANWLKHFVIENPNDVDAHISDLINGPSRMVTSYKGYYVNGYKFQTLDFGGNRKTMNSGVCVRGSCYNDYDRDFYGLLIDIIELNYCGAGNSIVLFKCDWFDIERGTKVHPRYGLVDVNHKSRLGTNEPFILAQQAEQVYYATYPGKKRELRDWWAICKTKARSRFDIPLNEELGETVSEIRNEYYQDNEMEAPTLVTTTLELDDVRILVDGGHLEEADPNEVHMIHQVDEEDEENEEELDLSSSSSDEENVENEFDYDSSE